MTTQRDWIGERQHDLEYQFDLLMVDVGEAIGAAMAREALTGKELAKRLNVSPARVSQILSGADNLTLKSLVSVAGALGLNVSISFATDESPGISAAGNSELAPSALRASA